MPALPARLAGPGTGPGPRVPRSPLSRAIRVRLGAATPARPPPPQPRGGPRRPPGGSSQSGPGLQILPRRLCSTRTSRLSSSPASGSAVAVAAGASEEAAAAAGAAAAMVPPGPCRSPAACVAREAEPSGGLGWGEPRAWPRPRSAAWLAPPRPCPAPAPPGSLQSPPAPHPHPHLQSPRSRAARARTQALAFLLFAPIKAQALAKCGSKLWLRAALKPHEGKPQPSRDPQILLGIRLPTTSRLPQLLTLEGTPSGKITEWNLTVESASKLPYSKRTKRCTRDFPNNIRVLPTRKPHRHTHKSSLLSTKAGSKKRILARNYNRRAAWEILPRKNSEALTTTCVFWRQKAHRRIGSHPFPRPHQWAC